MDLFRKKVNGYVIKSSSNLSGAKMRDADLRGAKLAGVVTAQSGL